jgi:polysaccharide export outer membrane protein
VKIAGTEISKMKSAATLLIPFFVTSLVRAQVPAPNPFTSMRAIPAQGALVNDVLPAQTVGADDLVSIVVFDCVELTRTFRVSSDGTLALPILGRIPAAGLMPVQLEEIVAERLKSTQTMVSPMVNVSVAEYRSKPVSVVGAVRAPVTFQAIGDTNLLGAITRAGGLAPEAGPEILVTRKESKEGGLSVITVQRIPVRNLMEADPAANVRLQGGEEVRVPEIGKIFVTGNVKAPGAFLMQENSDTTILKALALSQGTLPYSQKLAYIYRKDPVTSQRAEIPVQLEQIMARKSPDVLIYADDIIYIPENHGRKLAGNTLDRIAGTGSSVASALVLRR